MAIYVDEVHVQLFRRIEIGDVYANVKGGKFEMTFAEVEDKLLPLITDRRRNGCTIARLGMISGLALSLCLVRSFVQIHR